MKCIDCGKDFSPNRTEMDLKVELNNPGIVLFKGKAFECPQCKEKYTGEADIAGVLDNFEESHKKKNSLLKH